MSDNPYASSGSEESDVPQPRGRLTWSKWLVRGILGIGGILFLIALLLPAQRNSREAARRSQCKNNLKQIGLALHNYHEEWGGLPPAYTVDAEGKPLHSWRTLLLPYMDGKQLYDKIDLTKPWDDPVNAEVRATPYPNFLCPSDVGENTHTSYVALVGENFAFHPTRSRSFQEITDGLSNTVMVMEVSRAQSFDWMAPQDADEQTFQAFQPETKLPHKGGVHGLLCDGAVRYLSADLPPEKRRALITIDAGDEVGEF